MAERRRRRCVYRRGGPRGPGPIAVRRVPSAACRQIEPAERLACLLILRESRDPQAVGLLPKLLRDPTAPCDLPPFNGSARSGSSSFGRRLPTRSPPGRRRSRLFGGYLAALERLDGVVRTSDDEWAGEQYIVRALDDPQTPPEVRRWSLRMLRPDHPAALRSSGCGNSRQRRRRSCSSKPSARCAIAVTQSRMAAAVANCRRRQRIRYRCGPKRSWVYRATNRKPGRCLVSLAADEPALRERSLAIACAAPLERRSAQQALSADRRDPSRKPPSSSGVCSIPARAPARPARRTIWQGWLKLLDGSDDSPRATRRPASESSFTPRRRLLAVPPDRRPRGSRRARADRRRPARFRASD